LTKADIFEQPDVMDHLSETVTKDVPSIPLHKGHQEYHHTARNQGTEDKVARFQQISLAACDMAHPEIEVSNARLVNIVKRKINKQIMDSWVLLQPGHLPQDRFHLTF
jgi:hypothetical protein